MGGGTIKLVFSWTLVDFMIELLIKIGTSQTYWLDKMLRRNCVRLILIVLSGNFGGRIHGDLLFYSK